jgi:hypothetical protein
MIPVDWSNIIVAIIALLGTFIGSFSGIKLMSYRIEQLEKKVEKHNNLVERMYKIEEKTDLQEEKIKVANHRIDDLEKIAKEC